MPTYLGRPVVTIPSDPPAPAAIEFFVVDPATMSRSPFTGQQQVQSWGSTYMEATVTMPPLTDAQAQNWIAFLRALQGPVGVFQFSAAFCAAYPTSLNNASPVTPRYWCLKSAERKWSIDANRFYGFTFDLLEVV